MSDRIFIKGLSVHAFHGVMPHEGKVGQGFSIDLTLTVDLTAAARTDKVSDTVSYNQVAAVAIEAFRARRFKLIEAAAGAVADALFAHFPRVGAVEVTIHKPHAPVAAIFADIGVTLQRARR